MGSATCVGTFNCGNVELVDDGVTLICVWTFLRSGFIKRALSSTASLQRCREKYPGERKLAEVGLVVQLDCTSKGP